MTTTPQFILCLSPAPAVREIRLNRPRQHNALSSAMLAEIAAELAAAARDDGVRCLVISGNEQAFSAGADIKEMKERRFAALDDLDRKHAWRTIERFPKPLIAAVRGVAFGGGHELALLADIVVAADTALFAQPEINIGILPGDGATQRLPRIVGKSLAMKLVLTGEPIDAQTALRAGLVAEVVPAERTIERAVEIAATIARKPPVAARLAKEAVLAAYETVLSAGLDVERRAVRFAFTTADQAEGMAAFLEKRPPRFTGR